MNAQDEASTVKETVISCIGAPRLKGVSTSHLTAFKRLKELYEEQLGETGRQLKENVIPTSFCAPIEYDNLSIFSAVG